MVPLRSWNALNNEMTQIVKKAGPLDWVLDYWATVSSCKLILLLFDGVNERREKMFGGTFSPIFAAVTHAKINPFTVAFSRRFLMCNSHLMPPSRISQICISYIFRVTIKKAIYTFLLGDTLYWK